MSGLATLFGSLLATYENWGDTDVLSDTVKIGVVIAVGTAVLSVTFWTLTHLSEPSLNHSTKHSPIRGATAGFLTALCVIPLPVFAWNIKSQLLAAYAEDQNHVLIDIFEAIPSAIGTGLMTFQVLTKASLIALILSAALGYGVSRWWPGPDQPAGTSPRQP